MTDVHQFFRVFSYLFLSFFIASSVLRDGFFSEFLGSRNHLSLQSPKRTQKSNFTELEDVEGLQDCSITLNALTACSNFASSSSKLAVTSFSWKTSFSVGLGVEI